MNGNKFNFFTAIFVDLNGCSKFQNLGMVVLKLQQSKKKTYFLSKQTENNMDYYSTFKNIIPSEYLNLCVKNTSLEVGFIKIANNQPMDNLPLIQ